MKLTDQIQQTEKALLHPSNKKKLQSMVDRLNQAATKFKLKDWPLAQPETMPQTIEQQRVQPRVEAAQKEMKREQTQLKRLKQKQAPPAA